MSAILLRKNKFHKPSLTPIRLRSATAADNGKATGLGKTDNRISLEQQSLARFDGDDADVRIARHANCLNPNHRHIKAHVLVGFRNLDHDRAFARPLSPTLARLL